MATLLMALRILGLALCFTLLGVVTVMLLADGVGRPIVGRPAPGLAYVVQLTVLLLSWSWWYSRIHELAQAWAQRPRPPKEA